MNKAISAILSFILITGVEVKSQDELGTYDSLYQLVINNPDDSSQLRQLCHATTRLSMSHPDTAYYFVSELYKVSNGLNFKYGMAVALNCQGMILEQDDYRQSIEKYKLSLKISQKEHYDKLLSSTLNNLSIVYSQMGEYNQSIEYLLRSLKLAEEMKDTTRIAVALNNIGLRYHEMNNPEIALGYYRNARDLNLKTNNINRYATNISNIGAAYQIMNLNDSALAYHNQAIKLHRQSGNQYKMQYGFQALAFLYTDMGQYDEAWVMLDSAIYLAKEVDDSYGMINLMTAQGNLLNREKKFTESAQILNQAIDMALEMNFRSILVDLYKELSMSYRGQKNYIKAFEFNEKYMALHDSLQNMEKSKAFAQLNKYEKDKAEKENQILSQNIEIQALNIKRQKLWRNSIIIVGGLILLMLIGVWQRYRFIRRTQKELQKKNKIIESEKGKSDQLLLNILPAETANELKISGKSKARLFDRVTVMFADFKGFTMMAEQMSPQDLVDEIDFYYKKFDDIITACNIEKIKTIGDSYMCAGGLPIPNQSNPEDILQAACEIRTFMEEHKRKCISQNKPFFEARIGIHTGPVVAGIVGNRKFAYDIWGDTVNIASRMESSGEVGKINISQTTWEHVHDKFECFHRGKIETKHKGFLNMYFVKCSGESECGPNQQ